MALPLMSPRCRTPIGLGSHVDLSGPAQPEARPTTLFSSIPPFSSWLFLAVRELELPRTHGAENYEKVELA